ncbi:fimbrial protein [Burkholderia cepacia]|uniref:fimbrial protein n=1 Tax=Burkholderia cepacia TaxID=292 RepID=UPI00129753C0|nr:fimbrial protein [Burkholderia cepacia]
MRKRQSLLVLFTMLTAGPVFAVDAYMNFTGTVWAPSCTIDSSSTNQTVILASTLVGNFTSIGSTASAKAINVKLDCLVGTTVTMTVSGAAATVPSVLKNTGTAQQVGVQLLRATEVGGTTGTPIMLGSPLNLGAVSSSGTMTVPLVAQYYRLGKLTPGSVAATATLSFTYN